MTKWGNIFPDSSVSGLAVNILPSYETQCHTGTENNKQVFQWGINRMKFKTMKLRAPREGKQQLPGQWWGWGRAMSGMSMSLLQDSVGYRNSRSHPIQEDGQMDFLLGSSKSIELKNL